MASVRPAFAGAGLALEPGIPGDIGIPGGIGIPVGGMPMGGIPGIPIPGIPIALQRGSLSFDSVPLTGVSRAPERNALSAIMSSGPVGLYCGQ